MWKEGGSSNLTEDKRGEKVCRTKIWQLTVLGVYTYENTLTFLDHEAVADPRIYVTTLKPDFCCRRK